MLAEIEGDARDMFCWVDKLERQHIVGWKSKADAGAVSSDFSLHTENHGRSTAQVLQKKLFSIRRLVVYLTPPTGRINSVRDPVAGPGHRIHVMPNLPAPLAINVHCSHHTQTPRQSTRYMILSIGSPLLQ